jgi:hypothetical protein
VSVIPDDVQVGNCFITDREQVRRVTEITADDKVQYQARGAEFEGEASWGPGSVLSNPPTRAEFAAEVARRVTCDWDRRYPERKPED